MCKFKLVPHRKALLVASALVVATLLLTAAEEELLISLVDLVCLQMVASVVRFV
jgi:1,4-dihydroxy-2-naphthoate octaprenyltransferase